MKRLIMLALAAVGLAYFAPKAWRATQEGNRALRDLRRHDREAKRRGWRPKPGERGHR